MMLQSVREKKIGKVSGWQKAVSILKRNPTCSYPDRGWRSPLSGFQKSSAASDKEPAFSPSSGNLSDQNSLFHLLTLRLARDIKMTGHATLKSLASESHRQLRVRYHGWR